MFRNKLNGYLYEGENDASHILKITLQRKSGRKYCIKWYKTYQFIEFSEKTLYYHEFPKKIIIFVIR